MTNTNRRASIATTSDRARQLRRRRAEDMARATAAPSLAELGEAGVMPAEAMRRVLHELHVHQIELEMQNEELRRAHAELDLERARFFDLYDLAPVGYCTLSEEGLILQVNLTAASELGVARNELLKQRISRFIVREDQETYYLLRQRLLKSGEPQTCELRMIRRDGPTFWANIAAAVAQDESGGRVWRVVLGDITERKLSQEKLRIAAIAFESHGGIVVMDADRNILRVNHAFTQMSGYSEQEARGMTPAMLRSDQHSMAFYEDIWREVQRSDLWEGELWQRRKNGEDYPARITITAVRDEAGLVSHYVGDHTDVTNSRLLEQQRLRNERVHRNMLVREVHHRIKNNLQGVMGLLRKFAKQHPETAEPMRQAISQVQAISVIHGLMGRAITSAVHLCDLIQAIGQEAQSIWQTPVTLDLPERWLKWVVVEEESVPIALVLNELILNAVKHGGQANGGVAVAVLAGPAPFRVQIRITNTGYFSSDGAPTDITRSGLRLISALMPSHGARVLREQQGDQVVTLLEMESSIVFFESKEVP